MSETKVISPSTFITIIKELVGIAQANKAFTLEDAYNIDQAYRCLESNTVLKLSNNTELTKQSSMLFLQTAIAKGQLKGAYNVEQGLNAYHITKLIDASDWNALLV